MSEPSSSSASPYPAPLDDEFELDLMNIPDDIDGDENMQQASFDFNDAELDDMKVEDLSTWLDEELDQDGIKFFESVESEEDAEALEYDESAEVFKAPPVENRPSERPVTKPMFTPNAGSPALVTKPAVSNGNTKNDGQYTEALSNLAFSMRRTELSRAELLRQRNSMACYPKMTPQVAPASAQPSAMSSLAGLLTGKRTTLTVGLSQSRRQLREYMVRMNSNSGLHIM